MITKALVALISCATAGSIAVANIEVIEVKSAFADIKAQEFRTVCEAKSFALPEPDRAAFMTGCQNRSMAHFKKRVGASWNVSSN